MKNTLRFSLLACSLLLSACALPYRGIALQPTEYGAQDWRQTGPYRPADTGQPGVDPSMVAHQGGGEARLYSWDGGVVDSAPQGHVVPEESTRGIETSTTGRMHIIELYQEVLEERDELASEVEMLKATLRKTEDQVQGQRGDAGTLNAQIEALKVEQERLEAQNQELAERLTTAQIRRLEAERLLLKLRIDSHKKSSKPVEAPGGGQ